MAEQKLCKKCEGSRYPPIMKRIYVRERFQGTRQWVPIGYMCSEGHIEFDKDALSDGCWGFPSILKRRGYTLNDVETEEKYLE